MTLKRFVAFYLCCLPLFSTANELKPFHSDGCSLFPDQNLLTQMDWCQCCFLHDVAYWRGGTKMERKKADKDLEQCVLAKTHSHVLALVMYRGVRFGGSPYFYNWYYWGYGWEQRRGYQPLTAKQKKAADALFQIYRQEQNPAVCPAGS